MGRESGRAVDAGDALRVEVSYDGDGRALISATGDVDVATADQLKAALAVAIDQGHDVVLDLSRVSFLDSTGVAVIIATLNSARVVGSSLQLAAIAEQPRHVLELTGVLEHLDRLEGRTPWGITGASL